MATIVNFSKLIIIIIFILLLPSSFAFIFNLQDNDIVEGETMIAEITTTIGVEKGDPYTVYWYKGDGTLLETDTGFMSNIISGTVFETYQSGFGDVTIDGNSSFDLNNNGIDDFEYFNITAFPIPPVNISTRILIVNDAKFSPEAKLGSEFAVDFRVRDNNSKRIDNVVCSVFGTDINEAPLQQCTVMRDSVTHNGRGICSGTLDSIPFEEGQQYLAKIRCSCGIGDEACFDEDGIIVENSKGEVVFVFQVTPWLDSVNTITDKDSYTVDDDILVCANITNLNDERLSLEINYNWRCQDESGDNSTNRIIIESHVEERGISSNTTQNQCAKFRVPDEIIIEKGAVNCYGATEITVFDKEREGLVIYNTVSDIFNINVTHVHPNMKWKTYNNKLYEAEFSIEEFDVGVKNIELIINQKITKQFTPSSSIIDYTVTYANGSATPYEVEIEIEREFRNELEEDIVAIFIKDVNTTLDEEFKVMVTFYDDNKKNKIIAIVLAYGILIAFFTYWAVFVMKRQEKNKDQEKKEKMIEDLKDL